MTWMIKENIIREQSHRSYLERQMSHCISFLFIFFTWYSRQNVDLLSKFHRGVCGYNYLNLVNLIDGYLSDVPCQINQRKGKFFLGIYYEMK